MEHRKIKLLILTPLLATSLTHSMDLPQERISRTKINSDLNALQAQGKTYLEAIIILKERYKRDYQNVDEQIYNETYSFVNIFQDTESKFQRVPHTMAVHISRLTKELDIIFLDFVDFNKYSNALLKRVIDLGPAYLIPSCLITAQTVICPI